MNIRARITIMITVFAGLALTACGGSDDKDTVDAGTMVDMGTEMSTGTVTNERAVRGGALYDKWWAVADLDAPVTDHPLWADRPDTDSNMRTGKDTFRCKECHGWDYKGVDGRYSDGSHRTGIMGIAGTEMSTQEVFELLKDPAGHDYATVGLTDDDLMDLAFFVTDGLIDTTKIINADGSFTGDTAMGETAFMTCAGCHNADGLNEQPPQTDGGFDGFPGLISNENPPEFIHKVRFGQPGTGMPPQATIMSLTTLGDLGAHSQTLPQSL